MAKPPLELCWRPSVGALKSCPKVPKPTRFVLFSVLLQLSIGPTQPSPSSNPEGISSLPSSRAVGKHQNTRTRRGLGPPSTSSATSQQSEQSAVQPCTCTCTLTDVNFPAVSKAKQQSWAIPCSQAFSAHTVSFLGRKGVAFNVFCFFLSLHLLRNEAAF